MIKQAKYAENIRNYQEAEVLWLSLIKQKPDDVVAYVKLAKLLSDQNKTEVALALYQQALKIKPSVQIYTDLGMWLLDIQKPEEAITAFQEALRLNPGHQNTAQALNKLQHNSHDR